MTAKILTTSPAGSSPDGSNRNPLDAAAQLLHQGIHLLSVVGDAVYRRPLETAMGATIGGHYRHCLDHYHCLTECIRSGADVVDYDRRPRDPDVEQSRRKARETTLALLAVINGLPRPIPDGTLRARSTIDYRDATPHCVATSVEREVMYVVTHTVHHYALIGIIARSFGISLDREFGMAPSTLSYQAGSPACADALPVVDHE